MAPGVFANRLLDSDGGACGLELGNFRQINQWQQAPRIVRIRKKSRRFDDEEKFLNGGDELPATPSNEHKH